MDSNRDESFVFLPEPSSGPQGPTPPRRPVHTPKPASMAWAWLVVGIPLGILLTFLVQRSFGHRSNGLDAGNLLPVRSAPPIAATATPGPSPTTPTEIEEPSPLDALNFLPTSLGGPDLGGSPTGPAPTPMVGNLPNLPPVGPQGLGTRPLQPNGPTVGVEPPPVSLTTMSYRTGEIEADKARSKITAVATRLGGSAIGYSELAEKKVGDRSAVLLVVPVDKKAEALKALASVGASQEDDWQGAALERQTLLTEKLEIGLHNLRRQKEQLLTKYFEDAGPVQEVEERIAENERQLKAARVGKSESRAVIRVYYGPNA